MREVLNGCKVCGKRMLTAGSPLIHRTCDACKAKQRRTDNSRLAAKRKAKRHAAKAELNVPRCPAMRRDDRRRCAARAPLVATTTMGAQVLRQPVPASCVPRP
jgi:hypothetical protein